MFGAIYGDLVGSIYEYYEFLSHDKSRMIKASNEAELLKEDSFISDDTILTIAVLDAIKNNLRYEETIRRYILDNSAKLNKENYFEYLFSPNTIKWANGMSPGNSNGNGAMMRVSPIPFLRETYISVYNDVIEETQITHNSNEALYAALCISNIIFLGQAHYSLKKIKEIIDKYFPCDYNYSLDDLRNNMKFNYTCRETLPICLYALFNTSNFDDAIRLTLSIGGDTDTNCAIVGSMAESIYGISEDTKSKILAYLPEEYKNLLIK